MRVAAIEQTPDQPLPEQEAVTGEDIENIPLDDFPAWTRKYVRVLTRTGNMDIAAIAVGKTRQAVWKYANEHPRFKSIQSAAKAVFSFEMLIQNSVAMRKQALAVLQQRMNEGKLSDMALLAIAFNKFGTA